MTILDQVSDDQMIAEFIAAEVDSSRFAAIRQILNERNIPEESVRDTSIKNKEVNDLRRQLLKMTRGYEANSYLFTNFPEDTDWYLVEIEPQDFDNIKYGKHETWVNLTKGSRLLTDGAKEIVDDKVSLSGFSHIPIIAVNHLRGATFPKIILAKCNNEESIVLVEGHSRATAFAMNASSLYRPVLAILGTSDTMNRWAYF